jgi:hypothetical protein
MESIFRWGVQHTLDARERGLVLKHLYGAATPPSSARLRFPATRKRARKARSRTSGSTAR